METDFEIPEAFRCPISRQLAHDPVVANDGHIYSKSALQNLLRAYGSQNDAKSPVTGNNFMGSFGTDDLPVAEVPLISSLVSDYKACQENDSPCPLCNTQPLKAFEKYNDKKKETEYLHSILKQKVCDVEWSKMDEDQWCELQQWAKTSSTSPSGSLKWHNTKKTTLPDKKSKRVTRGSKGSKDSNEELKRRRPRRRNSNLGLDANDKVVPEYIKIVPPPTQNQSDTEPVLIHPDNLVPRESNGNETNTKAGSPNAGKLLKNITRRASLAMNETVSTVTKIAATATAKPAPSSPKKPVTQTINDTIRLFGPVPKNVDSSLLTRLIDVTELQYRSVSLMCSDECGYLVALAGIAKPDVTFECSISKENGPLIYESGSEGVLLTLWAMNSNGEFMKSPHGPPICIPGNVTGISFCPTIQNAIAVATKGRLMIIDYLTCNVLKEIALNSSIALGNIIKLETMKQFLVFSATLNPMFLHIVNLTTFEHQYIKCQEEAVIDFTMYHPPPVNKKEKFRRLTTRSPITAGTQVNTKETEEPLVVATLSRTEIRLWSLTNGRRLFSFQLPALHEHNSIMFPKHSNWRGIPRILVTSLSPEGKQSSLIFNFKNGRLVTTIRNDPSVDELLMSSVNAQCNTNLDDLEIGGATPFNLILKDASESGGWWWPENQGTMATMNENGFNIRDDTGSAPSIRVKIDDGYKLNCKIMGIMRTTQQEAHDPGSISPQTGVDSGPRSEAAIIIALTVQDLESSDQTISHIGVYQHRPKSG